MSMKNDHAILRLISKLLKHGLIQGLPKMFFKDDLLCKACMKNKQLNCHFKVRSQFPYKFPFCMYNL